MPPLPSPGPVLRIEWLFTVGADSSASVRDYWRYTGGPPTAANLATQASNLIAIFNNFAEHNMHPDNDVKGIQIQDLQGSTGAAGSYFATNSGTRAGGPLSAGTAVLVNYSIARRYRGGKPRAYWPFFTTNDLASNLGWVGTSATTLFNDYTTFQNAIKASGVGCTITDHVNVSYYSGVQTPVTLPSGRVKQASAPRATPLVDVITSYTVNTKPASQRRRNLH